LTIRGRAACAIAAVVTQAVALVAAGCGGTAASTATVAGSAPARAVVPTAVCGTHVRRPVRPRRVVWIVMENQAYSSVIGSRAAPYLNGLAASCGLATAFRAEAHPSLPNYIAMTSGSTHGIADDAGPTAHPVAGPSIFSELGPRWRALEESMPRACDLVDSGGYAVRHDPAVYYSGVRARCGAQDVPLGGAPRLMAPFTFVTPNLCHDMHSCPVQSGDAWLAAWLPRVLRSPGYGSGSMVIFITWDEDNGDAHQHVPTIIVSPDTQPGTRSATHFDHYSLLATTEDLLGVPRLGAAARATSMRGAFGLG
jgi:phosphatidylinositol-3-phosphatase